jgi:uncharacterized protein (DUF2252 family)
MDGTREVRRSLGRTMRTLSPRGEHAAWAPAPDRPDLVSILEKRAETRVPELLGLLYARMSESPFAFLRGSAAVMALDLAGSPVSGLRVQACGDAHVSNFGQFATPERNVIFDINDFDETLPGPWEWDVKRLAASLEVAFRGNGVGAKRRRAGVEAAVRSYREHMAEYASMRALDIWYAHIDADAVVSFFPRRYRGDVRRDIAKSLSRTNLRALSKLTRVVDGHPRFVEDPPLLVRLENTGHELEEVTAMIEDYRASLPHDIRTLFDRFRLVDVARKVVGVGSVGTRCWVGLLEGPHHPAGDPLILQVKEASASVLEPYLGASAVTHHGERVVAGQRLTQAASDIFLGWSEGPRSGRAYYVRQLWDVKGSGDPTAMDADNLTHYGSLCAWALARAHARTGDPVAISGYLGSGDRFDRALGGFAARYGDQTEADHATLVAAIAAGRLPSA